MSAWIISKQEEEEEIDAGKGNLFCLARGQTEQSKVLLILQLMTSGTRECNKTNLCGEGWPNLQCHRLVLSILDVQELKQKEEILESLASTVDTDSGNEAVDWLLCNV